MKFKTTIIDYTFFNNLSSDDIHYLSETFFFINEESIRKKTKSRYIVAYKNNLEAKNILGVMKVSRYLSEDYKIFLESYKLNFDVVEYPYSILDTYIHNEFVEVRKDFRNQCVGSTMYSFLEDILTSADIIYESSRTDDGIAKNLLRKVSKCIATDDFYEVYYR